MIVAIIPARGGSKGVPQKNIRPLAGKPLIEWSILAARQSLMVERIVISTEDSEIAEVARAAGAEVLIRPPELATDTASTLSVLQHAVAQIPCNTVVLLQPTSPIRRAGLIDACIGEFSRTGADSLATGFQCTYTAYGTNAKPRQKIQGFFYDDGNVYVIKASLIREGERYGARIAHKITTREENIDIDDEFDFWLAGKVLTERMAGLEKMVV